MSQQGLFRSFPVPLRPSVALARDHVAFQSRMLSSCLVQITSGRLVVDICSGCLRLGQFYDAGPAHGAEHATEAHVSCSGSAPRVVRRSACLVEIETPQRLVWACGVCCTLDIVRYPTPERDRAVSLRRHERCLARLAALIDAQNLEGAA